MRVLLLGWEFMPENKEAAEVQGDFLSLTQALGKQMDLSMILPVADPRLVLQNVTLTGLNTIDLPSLAPVSPKKTVQPFEQGAHIRQAIPLYGAPVHPSGIYPTGQAEQSGQAAAAGMLKQSLGQQHLSDKFKSQNIFGEQEGGESGLADQVIQYARWATRLAVHQQFDVIYAYDWRTFLAGMELKLISDKPLVLQIDSLSVQHPETSQQGWMYQVEVQALQKADCIITPTDDLSGVLQKQYQIPSGLISSLEEKNQGWPSEVQVLQGFSPVAGLPEHGCLLPLSLSPEPGLAENAGEDGAAQDKASRIHGILTQVAA